MPAQKKSAISCKAANRLLCENEEFILFDTETTGLSAENCVIIEISALKIRSRDLSITDELTVYIRPELPVPRQIEVLTGITNQFLETCPDEREAFGSIRAFFGKNTVCGAYNTPFDRSFMDALFARFGEEFSVGRECFDVLRMARELYSREEVPSFQLAHLYRSLGLCDQEEPHFHDARDDVRATYSIFCRLCRDYLALPQEEAGQRLHAQIGTIQSWNRFNRVRIYVNLRSPRGTVYYDLKDCCWQNKDMETDLLSLIDTDLLRQDVLDRTGAKTEADLWNFSGKA